MHTEIIVSGAHLPDLQGKGQLRQDGQGGEQPLLQVDHHQYGGGGITDCSSQVFLRDPKKMFMHYGKHLYDEGRVFKHIPPVDGSAEGFDEYGRVYRWTIRDGSRY